MTYEPGDSDGGLAPFEATEGDAPRSVDITDREYAIYRCQDCANVVLTMQECDGGMTCHDEPLERVEHNEVPVRPPDVRQVLHDAFGLPRAGLDVCLCVIGDGPLSPEQLADRLDYDVSTVRKYLNELVEFGLLEKSQLNRESGGIVNVYHSISLAQMREDTLVGFYTWAGEAASMIEAVNLRKADYQDHEHEGGLEEIFWDGFDEN